MSYSPPQFGTDEFPTSTKFNLIKSSMDWLYARLPFLVGQNCVSKSTRALYVVSADIYPGNAGGNGDDGLTWERVAGGQGAGFMIVKFNVPSSVFSATPKVVGITVGAGDYPWLMATSRYGESATGFTQRFGMTDGGAASLGAGLFNVSALLIGTRKTEPT